MGYVLGCIGGAGLIVSVVFFIAAFGFLIGPCLWFIAMWCVIAAVRWLYRRVDPNAVTFRY